MKKSIYAGSFDPIHYGHIDIIKRASKISDKLYIAVLGNSNKQSTLTLNERVELVKNVTRGINNVEVVTFDGLLVEYVKEHNIDAIIKGIRNTQDFQYEYNLANGIKVVDDSVETVVLFSSLEHSYLSSTIVRDFAVYSNNLDKFTPTVVGDYMVKKMGR